MLVKDVIKALKKCNPNARVVSDTNFCDTRFDIQAVKQVTEKYTKTLQEIIVLVRNVS